MRLFTLAVALAFLPSSAQAADAWTVANDAARSVTGDILVDRDTVTFAGGPSLRLKPYEMARNGDWAATGDGVAGDVFKIEPASNPNLLDGKTLCSEPATFVVLWTYGEGELTLNVYSGDAAPTGLPDIDSLCASYSYELR